MNDSMTSALLEIVFQTSSDGLLIVNAQNQPEKFNTKFCELCDLDRSRIQTKSLDELLELFQDRSDGKIIQKHSQELAGNTYILWTFRDVTAEKRSEEILSGVLNLSPDIISVINPVGELVFNSQAALRIHGYTNEEMVGRNTFDFIHPDDQDAVSNAMASLFERPEQIVSVQYRYRNKDQSWVWMEATAYNQIANPLINGLIVISRDISRRKKMENELRAAIVARDQFVSVASHEFKTPMVGMKLLIQIMEREYKKSGVIKEGRLDNLLEQLNNLLYLVDDLFNVNQMRSGQFIYHFERADVSELLKKVMERFALSIQDSGCEVTSRLQENVMGEIDGPRFERVFSNLIHNALKYAAETKINIELSSTDRDFIFIIEDEGPGIPTDKQQMIFEAFERAADKQRFTGLGLGLYICRQIVQAHQGQITVESGSSRKGSRFKVTIPLQRSVR